MKHFISISSAVLITLMFPIVIAMFMNTASPASENSDDHVLSSSFLNIELAAQDWQERPSRQPRAPRAPQRSPRNDEPLPEIEIDYDRPIDLHSPPGFSDPDSPGDNPETPVPLPGVVWLMLAGGVYAVRKLHTSRTEQA